MGVANQPRKCLFFQEIGQEAFALLGEEAFGMVLDAFQGPGLVADAHDFVVVGVGGDFEFGGEGAVADDEGVVAGGGKRIGHSGVDRFAIVVDLIGFAVHEPGGSFDDCAADVADALMAQADSQDGDAWAEMADDVVADAALFGRAWAGGDDDVGGMEGFDLVEGDFVVAEYLYFRAWDRPRRVFGPS